MNNNKTKKSGDGIIMNKSFEKLFEGIDMDFKSIDERFAGNEKIILKFIKKFEKDETFSKLEKAVNEYNKEAMIVYSHDLKGLSANLGMKKLSSLSNDMLSELRNNIFSNIPMRFNSIKKEYINVIQCIKKI